MFVSSTFIRMFRLLTAMKPTGFHQVTGTITTERMLSVGGYLSDGSGASRTVAFPTTLKSVNPIMEYYDQNG